MGCVGNELALALAGLVQAEAIELKLSPSRRSSARPSVDTRVSRAAIWWVALSRSFSGRSTQRVIGRTIPMTIAPMLISRPPRSSSTHLVTGLLGRHPQYGGTEHATVVDDRTGHHHLAGAPREQGRGSAGRRPASVLSRAAARSGSFTSTPDREVATTLRSTSTTNTGVCRLVVADGSSRRLAMSPDCSGDSAMVANQSASLLRDRNKVRDVLVAM